MAAGGNETELELRLEQLERRNRILALGLAGCAVVEIIALGSAISALVPVLRVQSALRAAFASTLNVAAPRTNSAASEQPRSEQQQDRLVPHPRNPRLHPHKDVVETLAALMTAGLDPAHALIVREIPK
jgi:hypothetical protein